MRINLHTSSARPDWETVKADQRNIWQKIAVSTKGVVTPGNIISALGAGIVIAGFVQLDPDTDNLMLAAFLIMLGRSFDLLDGYAADRTGTKSHLGETIDAALDKVLLFMAVIFTLAYGLIPDVVLVILLVHGIFNSYTSLAGKLRKIPTHPSLAGKLSTFLGWSVIVLFVVRQSTLQESGIFNVLITVLAYASFAVFVVLASVAARNYYSTLKRFSNEK